MKVLFDEKIRLVYGKRHVILEFHKAFATTVPDVVLTPGQAMRLASRLQRWAIGKHPTRKIT